MEIWFSPDSLGSPDPPRTATEKRTILTPFLTPTWAQIGTPNLAPKFGLKWISVGTVPLEGSEELFNEPDDVSICNPPRQPCISSPAGI